MADRNIRNIDPALCAALKSEAAAAGKGLDEYCIEILKARHIQTVKVELPSSALPDPLHAARDPLTGTLLKQPEPGVVYGMWGEDGAEKADAAPVPVSGPGVVVMPKPQCPHGYLNRGLCPQCRAA
jgi:hypothetical protein